MKDKIIKNKKMIIALIISYIVVIAITIHYTHYYDTHTSMSDTEYSTHASNTFDEEEEIVYVAPHSGTKYHSDEFCRGLSNAQEVESINLDDAESEGYEPCDLCY